MKFIVNLEVPPDCTPSLAAAYIREAVQCWSGGYGPDHPLFGKTHNAAVKRDTREME